MENENLITSMKYTKEEISVEDAVKRDVEVLQETPYGYNAKNWRIEVEFLEKSFIIKTFGDGKED